MQKCKRCKFRSVEIQEVRDGHGKVVLVQDFCNNCNVVVREKKVKPKRIGFWKRSKDST